MEQKLKSSSVQKRKFTNCQKSGNNSQFSSMSSSEGKHRKNEIILGVCAMKKKVQSKPMKQILQRIQCKQIKILEMWQFLDQHWSRWPRVDALICFHSDGFPYLMAWKYVKKHKPFLINNLDKQQLLWDRTVVYDILRRIKVPVAKHYMIFKDMNYLDTIQARGNGKYIPDPCEENDIQLPVKLDKKINSETIQPENDANISGKVKVRHLASMFESFDKEQDRPETSKFLKPKIQGGNNQIEEEVVLDFRKNRQELKAKVRHKFSEINILDNFKNSPSTLRNYVQKRWNELKKFEVQQVEDHLVIKYGQHVHKLKKPFVEKPFDAQNHQICVYYPENMGGGRKKLFRKINNSSSQYQNNQNSIRRDGNYIYEQFLPTNAFDIKVYTIGPYYMYAEARRSPTLDGVVQRNEDGKQMRYPVILTPDEKFICNRIVQEFEQQVCGFDLLRANGKSYVCDVNGWSFVKSNPKYWDDCSIILKKKIFQHFFPQKSLGQHGYHYERFTQNYQNQYRPPMDNINLKVQELRSIVSIFRHGDRSPKLKLKIKTKDKRFIQFFNGSNKDELKIKDAKNLFKILDITAQIVNKLEPNDSQFKEYMQMYLVLQSGGHFQGFTRKVQLKVVEREEPKIEYTGKPPIKKVLIVLKWGGALSYLGFQDAIELGKKMRMQRYDDHDCLSLYSSYRHDLKTYSSDEGRCIKTAAAFLKGFLNIEGQIAPIITSMVNMDAKAQQLLDCTSQQNHSQLADQLQVRLSEIMNSEQPLINSYLKYCEDKSQISESLAKIIQNIGFPRKKLQLLMDNIKNLVNNLEDIYFQKEQEQSNNQNTSSNQIEQVKGQDVKLIYSRWSKLKKDFYDEKAAKFNISKVPQIFDTIRHDLRKNLTTFNFIDAQTKDELYALAKTLAYFVVINQYGITDEERIQVGKDICLPLLRKILIDLMFWKQKNAEQNFWKYKNEAQNDNWRHIRTRLYFGSASHMYSLLNILSLGNKRELLKATPEQDANNVRNILYMSYLSHIQFRLYENLTMPQNNPDRFRLEISFSTEYNKDKQMKQFSLGGRGFTINRIKQFIERFIGKEQPQKYYHSKSKGHGQQKRKHSD